MRIASKFLALGLLLALKPACGSGGGGGAGGGTGASYPALPMLVAPIPLAVSTGGLAIDGSAATFTINVLTMTDAAAQTAIQNALNAANATKKIVVTSGGGPRTIVLTAVLKMPSDSGSPKTVILDGMDEITLSGGLTTRILEIDDVAQLTVQRMKFVNARTPQNGGAINSNDTVRQVTIINCSFDNCQTTDGGPDFGGGALRIWNGQHTQISGCTFNKCAGSNGGAVNSLGTRLTILNSTFTQNSAFGTGGGAEVVPIPGKGGIGGAVYVDNVSNDAAALHQLQLTGCVFNANVANDHAGALFGYTTAAKPSTTIIDRCTFAGNVVVGGHGHSGALYSQDGTLTLTNSTFNLNTATTNGGGMFCTNTTSTISNCTFQGNSSVKVGGGVFTTKGNVSLLNVTMAQNSSDDYAGGLFSLAASTTVQNCVFSANLALGNVFAGDHVNVSFTGGANVQAPNTGTGTKPVTVGTTPVPSAILGPLQDNTGPTFTMRPLAGSPAINLAGVAGAPATDQRGAARSGTADAGACEGP